jgi:hypothetical protein
LVKILDEVRLGILIALEDPKTEVETENVLLEIVLETTLKETHKKQKSKIEKVEKITGSSILEIEEQLDAHEDTETTAIPNLVLKQLVDNVLSQIREAQSSSEETGEVLPEGVVRAKIILVKGANSDHAIKATVSLENGHSRSAWVQGAPKSAREGDEILVYNNLTKEHYRGSEKKHWQTKVYEGS